jgi:RecA-family ATPase
MAAKTELQRDKDAIVREVRAQLGDVKPVIVVLDTLNKSLQGGENNVEDMTAYVRAAEVIRDAFDCAVLIVHHCGYDTTHMRGSTSLIGAVDFSLMITRTGHDGHA